MRQQNFEIFDLNKHFRYLRKVFTFLILIGVIGTNLWAQAPFFNEWYNLGQSYVKLRTFQDGLYRVNKADLQAAGVNNIGAMTPQNLQLFFRGQEVPIYIEDDGFGGVAAFEFLGWKNDGAFDSLLYRDHLAPFGNKPEYQTNSFFSMYTDTAAFFLTWEAGNNIMRALCRNRL